MSERTLQFQTWVAETTGIPGPVLQPLANDASQRRYYRVHGQPLVAMDAPPHLEKNREFVAIARHIREAGLLAPRIQAADFAAGFLLVEDLGDLTYAQVAQRGQCLDGLYRRAIEALVKLQATPFAGLGLPLFDRAFCDRELEIFTQWFVEAYCGLAPWAQFQDVRDLLWANIDEQPRTFMHRDYHSRNLMVAGEESPGILDFQDAVDGPVSYDLVSLLRDCYQTFSDAQIAQWTEHYLSQAAGAGVLDAPAQARFPRWFDLTGLQRHLKCLGIFARLSLRDGKHVYLGDLPRVLGYVRGVTRRYAELGSFDAWLEQCLVPAFASKIQSQEVLP